jgi:hypothetical protein
VACPGVDAVDSVLQLVPSSPSSMAASGRDASRGVCGGVAAPLDSSWSGVVVADGVLVFICAVANGEVGELGCLSSRLVICLIRSASTLRQGAGVGGSNKGGANGCDLLGRGKQQGGCRWV